MIEIENKSCFSLPASCLSISGRHALNGRVRETACLQEGTAHQRISRGQKAAGKGRITVV